MSTKLNGKRVAITGGARGIGAATAEAFIAAGARVAIGDIDAELAAKSATGMANARPGATVAAFELDVTDTASFSAFLDSAHAELGGLDVLVNNAGIMPTGRFLDTDQGVDDRQLDINLRGVVLGSRLGGRRFVADGGGHLVNIASVAGVAAAPGVATYCATKHAVVGLGSALHQELAEDGVKVTTICPGFVNTELIAGITPPWLVRKIGYVQPEDVANAIVDEVWRERGGQRFVPRSGGAALKAMTFMPENLRNRISKLLGMQHVTLDTDESVRGAYRDRTEQLDLASTRKRGRK
ncbi:NADP-dependent 3-hydroxy acid dehydrogenase YdfG [Herbihabitans rhizosphaerae]|uniref:NADP-dependent 3-hydroxy acid dehydrogenase YdfG n=1 Tax=Herbihabitans rhizosphaerae TaxID=1872711 RepID=A0A4Q7L5G3_9PSEU|nr:SDR family NAD(P)-dependent oxidoreductase [Herbihabitans rhizosphaerae]RZS43492.1 NADP-dependent 3-hydroxy acid dehydrogenase YdfG [Herbihabitans rhizosphaerae]